MSRFTIDGSDALERQLAEICDQARMGVEKVVPARKIEALVLGGGYGRGEGGVLRIGSGDAPYNDVEFYLFIRGARLVNEKRYGKAVFGLAEDLSKRSGLHVEFKIDSLDRLRETPISMFTYDLVSASRAILGRDDRHARGRAGSPLPAACPSANDGAQGLTRPAGPLDRGGGPLLFNTHATDSGAQRTARPSTQVVESEKVFQGCDHHRQSHAISLSEATRLLYNRCSGLLLARELLARGQLSENDSDFIGRNLAKASLALGDAMLVMARQYHWSARVRSERLANLSPEPGGPDLEQIQRHHRIGLEFKLHPRRAQKSSDEFAAEHRELSALTKALWLWVESRRLRHPFTTIQDYAFSTLNKCPETSAGKNYLLTARTFGPAALTNSLASRYPRERLFNSLPLLLWNGEVSREPGVRRHLQKQLESDASDWTGLVQAYKKIWPAYG